MENQEIQRDQWIRFFNDFSKRHEGWIVTMEVLGMDLGDQEESEALPLIGIGADTKGGENRVEIMLGGKPEQHLTRIINAPKRILHRPAAPDAYEAIEVESEDGTATLIRFRYVLPEATERQLPDHSQA